MDVQILDGGTDFFSFSYFINSSKITYKFSRLNEFFGFNSFWSQDPYNRYVVVVLVGLIQKFCLKIAKIENCKNWKLLGLQVVKIAICQNCKLP